MSLLTGVEYVSGHSFHPWSVLAAQRPVSRSLRLWLTVSFVLSLPGQEVWGLDALGFSKRQGLPASFWGVGAGAPAEPCEAIHSLPELAALLRHKAVCIFPRLLFSSA